MNEAPGKFMAIYKKYRVAKKDLLSSINYLDLVGNSKVVHTHTEGRQNAGEADLEEGVHCLFECSVVQKF